MRFYAKKADVFVAIQCSKDDFFVFLFQNFLLVSFDEALRKAISIAFCSPCFMVGGLLKSSNFVRWS